MINVIEYSAHLSNNLTAKILEKFQQSVDDFFNRISETYRQDIKYLSKDNKSIRHSQAETYHDGSLKNTTDYWDLMNQDDKEEAISLIDLFDTRMKEVRTIRKYLLPLANKCLTVNNLNEVTSYELLSYTKFFNCLPDFITQDRELLLRQGKLDTITEQDLQDIEKYSLTVNKEELSQFVKDNRNEEVEKVLSQLYALEFLMDF